MSARTLKLTIAALGGQGGGVLTDWLISIAESCQYIVQSTSVPGVAQRTGATIYYLEFFARSAVGAEGREPVMALMPVPGDVDCVVASELAEAGRAIQRGLVSEHTTLITSSHRAYAILEKSALGRGMADSGQLLELVRSQGARSIVFDMEAIAERHHSVISAVLLGALSGAGVLPFPRQAFEDAIRKSQIAVATNLAAFGDAHALAAAGGSPAENASPPAVRVPTHAPTPQLQELLDRLGALPAAVQLLAFEGVRRTLDYQDAAYAGLYLTRLERVAILASTSEHAARGQLLEAVARGLALWMSFEDTIRVADLKTRASRFTRVRHEVRAAPGQIVGITEFMSPRAEEIAGTLPLALGRRLLGSARSARWLAKLAGGKQIRTSSLSGFLLLYTVAGMRRWRRATLRFHEEDSRIEAWLAGIAQLAAAHPALAIEVARAQRLIKGYGETHERGWRNFSTLVGQIELLAARPDGAAQLARLQEAALADEEGAALARAITALAAAQPAPAAMPA